MQGRALDHLKLAAQCSLAVCAALGAFGMSDTNKRKLPLTTYGAILLYAGVTRDKGKPSEQEIKKPA